MNRKGVAILLLSAIGFLVAVLLFFSTVNRLQVVGNSSFLGGTQAQVLDTFLGGEQLMIFLENSVRLSLKGDDFAKSFSAYIEKANRLFGVDMRYGDFSFEKDEGRIVVTCNRKVTLRNSGVEYSIRPNFVVSL